MRVWCLWVAVSVSGCGASEASAAGARDDVDVAVGDTGAGPDDVAGADAPAPDDGGSGGDATSADATSADTTGDTADEPDVAAGPAHGLRVSSDAARACEVLFSDPSETAGFTFDASVDGAFDRRGARLALAVTATADAALGTSVTVVGAPVVESARCFDRLGAPIDAAVEVLP